LRSAHDRPDLLIPNTQEALAALTAAEVFDRSRGETLGDNYRFLRRVESGLRLLNTSARHDLPTNVLELRQLAMLLGHSNAERLAEQCLLVMAANRELFDRFTA
jgi:[glutamine synthetase] adenylyltransferase / [glutamine synthetase]-adenylyl-L-tyrosine phosphorylase